MYLPWWSPHEMEIKVNLSAFQPNPMSFQINRTPLLLQSGVEITGTQASINPDLCGHMVSLGCNDFNVSEDNRHVTQEQS